MRDIELAKLLKTEEVKISDLIEGDVIIDEHSVWEVAKISFLDDGLEVCDQEQDNIAIFPWPDKQFKYIDSEIVIIDRECLKKFNINTLENLT